MNFLKSSIGKKYLMGIAGAGWALFVAGHMAGNLFIFGGAEAYNRYGHAIVSNKLLLYGSEVMLSACLIIHVVLAILLTKENRAATPQKYAVNANEEKKARFGSKTMAFQGSVILAFIIYHLITFKYGPYYEIEYNGVVMRDLHRLMVEVFSNPAYVVGYVVCLLLLGVHLSHGVSSVFQSWGLLHPKYNPGIRKLGWVYSIVVAGGFIAQPVYIFLFQ